MDRLLPIGLSDFKQVIEGGYAYADKSLLIQELIAKGGTVALIPRLRRFGKTLNLSMLRYFLKKARKTTATCFIHLTFGTMRNAEPSRDNFLLFLSPSKMSNMHHGKRLLHP